MKSLFKPLSSPPFSLTPEQLRVVLVVVPLSLAVLGCVLLGLPE